MPFRFREQQPTNNTPVLGRDEYGFFSEEWDPDLKRVKPIEWIPISKGDLEYLDGWSNSKMYQSACRMMWRRYVR